MNKLVRNIALIVGLLVVGSTFLKGQITQFTNNVSFGKFKIKGFRLNLGTQIITISSFQDFKSIFSAANLAQLPAILSGNFSFAFGLEIPVQNDNNVSVPNNSFTGQLIFGDKVIGNVSYPPTPIPANGNITLNTNITVTPSQLGSLVNTIISNPAIINEGVQVTGNLMSGGISIPYTEQVKFF